MNPFLLFDFFKPYTVVFLSSRMLIFVGAFLTICAPRARAEWWGDGTQQGSDISMREVMVPEWAETTYYACWSSGGYNGPYFYGGFTFNNQNRPEEPYHTSLIWSFWPHKKKVVQVQDTNPKIFAEQYVGEGASGKASGFWHLETKTWYRMVIRAWDSPEPDTSMAGWWMKDLKSGEWHHVASMRIPVDNYKIDGNGGFIEDFGHGNRNPRAQSFRASYHRVDGKWHSGTWSFPPKSTEHQRIVVAPDKSAVEFTVCANPFSGSSIRTTKEEVELVQPAQPVLDPIVVEYVRAQRNGGQVAVEWKLDEKSSPQLSYALGGRTIADATARTALIPELQLGAQEVQLIITDIFDQQKTVSIPITTVDPRPASAEAQPTAGLHYKTYLSPTAFKRMKEKFNGNWHQLPDFTGLPVATSGVVNDLDLSIRPRSYGYAVQFTGTIDVPTTGMYLLHLRSSDGSRLYVNDQLAVDRNQLSSPSTTTSPVALEAGVHTVRVDYFKNWDDDRDTLSLEWEGPGLARQAVPIIQGERQFAITEPKPDSTHSVHTVPFSVSLKDAKKVEYLLRGNVWASSEKAPFSTTAFLPDGTNTVIARATMKDGTTLDSRPVTFTTKNSPLRPDWNHYYYNQHAQPGGFHFKDDQLSVIGDGTQLFWREVTGDFTLSTKVESMKSIAGRAEKLPWASGAGLFCRPDFNDPYLIGGKYLTLFATVNYAGRRVSTNNGSNGGGPMWLEGLPFKAPCWLRVVRRGNEFTTAYSLDGQEWKPIKTEILELPETLRVGAFTMENPDPTLPVMRVDFSDLKLSVDP